MTDEMKKQEEIKKLEEQHLKEVLKKVVNAKETTENTLQLIGQGNLDKLKDLREDPETGTDFELFLYQLEQSNNQLNIKDKFARLEELQFLSQEPYFARIDLSDSLTDQAQEIYIGKFGYSERMPIVTDWRAKVASVYYRYRYPQKNVSYEAPEGTITKDLTLKRTFEIDEGELIKYYNNDIQLDENEIIVEKMKGRTGGVLQDIVETIQISQLDIIEEDPRKICLVQGCVGSGKSTVAIHKLAHIFFNYPKLIHPEKSILVAKNQILVGYLSTLFPKLGIFNINYKTLRELLIHFIFREELAISVDFEQGQDTSSFDIKQIEKINTSIKKIHNKYQKRVEDICGDPEFASFASYKYAENLSPLENLNELYADIEEELTTEKDQLKEDPNSPKAWLLKDNIRILRRIINKLDEYKIELRKTDFQKILKEFTSFKVKANYLETLIYVYIYSELFGLSKFSQYEYCVVDEGQDFSVLEYLVLGKLVLRGRMAIFGDLNQSLETDGISNWSDVSKVVSEAKEASKFELNTNYRSTKPIIDLATKVLSPFTKKYLPKSINRKGEEPKVIDFNTTEEMLKSFELDIKNDAENIQKSIGVICFGEETHSEAEKILDKLNLGESLLKLDSKTKIHYLPKGVYLMSADDCKGLEFSKVYVLNINLSSVKEFASARKVFVAVTRAMNDLVIYGVKD